MHRIKIRLFRYLVPIIGISHPHQPCYSLPTANSFFISSTSRRWPFVSTWHRLPSSKFEDGNVVGRKKLTKRYSFSLSNTHTHTDTESFPIMVEAEMRTNVPPPRFRLSATSASTTTFRIPKYRSRNKLNAIPVSRISYCSIIPLNVSSRSVYFSRERKFSKSKFLIKYNILNENID